MASLGPARHYPTRMLVPILLRLGWPVSIAGLGFTAFIGYIGFYRVYRAYGVYEAGFVRVY